MRVNIVEGDNSLEIMMIQKLKQGVLWFGLLCLVVSFFGCGSPEERKIKYYEKGKVLLREGNYRDARLELKNALQIDPEFVDGYFMLGKIEFENKEFDQAGKYLNKVLQLSPQNIDARLMLAEIGLFAREYEYALKKVKEVQNIQPGNVKAQVTESFILASTGKKPQARAIVEKLLATGSDDPGLYIVLAATYSWKNEKRLIEDTYKQGLSNNPESSRLLRALTNLYISEKKNEEALQILTKLIKNEPDAAQYKFILAQLYWDLGRHSDAEKIIDKITAAGFENVEAILLSAKFYTTVKMYDSAERILLNALQQKPGNFRYHFALSDLYVMQGKNQDAIKTLEQQLLLKEGEKDLLILKTQNTLAKIYLALGDNDKALEYVEKVIAANRHDRDAHFTKGNIFLAQGEGDKAVTEFRSIITENPRFIEGHLRLAEANVINKNYEQATTGLQRALEDNSGSKELMRGLAQVYMLKNETEKADAMLRKIRDLYPNDFQTRLWLADLLLSQSKLVAAKIEYDNLTTLVPNNPTPYLRLSRLSWSDGRKKEAVAILERALRVDSPSSQVFAALVQLYLNQKQFDEAVKICQQRLQDDPDNAFYHYMLGQVRAAEQDYGLAEEKFNKAIELAPSWLAPQQSLAALYAVQGKTGEAIAKLEETIAGNLAKQEIYITLAILYEQQGDFEKTINTYERALTVNPKSWVALNNVAYALMEYHDDKASLEKALGFAERARNIRPQLKEIADTLSWAYFKNENYAQAYTITQKAFPVPPEDPTILFHIASILYKNGKIAEAKANVLKALESKEEFSGRKQAENLLQNIIALAQ